MEVTCFNSHKQQPQEITSININFTLTNMNFIFILLYVLNGCILAIIHWAK